MQYLIVIHAIIQRINNSTAFRDLVKAISVSHWITLHDYDCLCLCTADVVDNPRITTAVKIMRNLNVKVDRGESHVKSSSLAWILVSRVCLNAGQSYHHFLITFFTDVDNLSVKKLTRSC